MSLLPPLPALRPPLPPLAAQPTTEQLLDQMIVVMHFPQTGWQARRKGCKDYGRAMPTPREAMLEALK